MNDDSLYLNHNIKKEPEFAGAIIQKNRMPEIILILSQYSMDTIWKMVPCLKRFTNLRIPSSLTKINISTFICRNISWLYKIYAAYVYDDRHILNSFDFGDKKILKKYFKYTLNPDSLTKNTREVDLDVNSKILTLSTCTNGAENTRYLVQGVFVKDEPTN